MVAAYHTHTFKSVIRDVGINYERIQFGFFTFFCGRVSLFQIQFKWFNAAGRLFLWIQANSGWMVDLQSDRQIEKQVQTERKCSQVILFAPISFSFTSDRLVGLMFVYKSAFFSHWFTQLSAMIHFEGTCIIQSRIKVV